MTTKAQSIGAGLMLLEKLSSDKMLATKIDSARSYSDFLRLAETEGFDLSGLSEEEAIALAKGDRGALGEISDEELEQVAGGTQYNALALPLSPPETTFW
jgi:predicted ribosomally synthesized peptide with nif11-like leader